MHAMHSMHAVHTHLRLTFEHVFYKMSMPMSHSQDAQRSGPPPPRLYRRSFTPAERLMLDRHTDQDGHSELNLLRVLLARLAAASARAARSGRTLNVALLSVYSLAAINMSALELIQLRAARDAPDPALEMFAAASLEDL